MGFKYFGGRKNVVTFKLRHMLRAEKSSLLMVSLVLGALSLSAPPARASSIVDGDLLLGEVKGYTVQKRETLFDIARKFGMGIVELQAANPGVDPWKPKAGSKVTVTTKHVIPSITRDGIVINLSSSRLFYFKGPGEVLTFPIASGKEGWETPVAATTITQKRKNPTWTPTPRIREENPELPDVIPAGPDNPLGQYALALGLNAIMIHGTNSPASIGRRASHGCIRMYPEDIKKLFHEVEKGTPVLITKTPYVIGWQGDTLYLQVTPKVRSGKKLKKPPAPDEMLRQAVAREAGQDATIYWNVVDGAMARADGIPTVIGTREPFGPAFPEPLVEAFQPRRASLMIINDAAQLR
jgi:L,D-transpeptidase ErfK/SrfK